MTLLSGRKDTILSSDEDEEENYSPAAVMNINNDKPCLFSSQYSSEATYSSSQVTYSSSQTSTVTSSEDSQNKIGQQKRKKLTEEEATEKKRLAEERKIEKERLKAERQQDRERKRLEKQQEAAAKKAERDAHKAEKPTECLKYMTVLIDDKIISKPSGPKILEQLQQSESQYTIRQQPVSNSLTWMRKLPSSQQSASSTNDEDNIVVILSGAEFCDMLKMGGYVGSDNLMAYISQVKELSTGKELTLIVTGMDDYIRSQKSSPKLNRSDVDRVLVELQLQASVNIHETSTADEVARLVTALTKAVAEKPFKLKRNKALFSFCHQEGDCTSGSAVSEDGSGVTALWINQIKQFRNVSRDKAVAIAAQFPTPLCLIQAYRNSKTEKEASLLLKNIVVRRGFGALETNRKIGPELSKQMHLFFTATSGDTLIINE